VKFSLRSWCFLLIAASIAVIFLSTAVLKGNARPSQLLNLQDSRNPFLADSSPEKQDVNWGREVVGTQTNFQFAVIGDYGSGSAAESDVADLVRSWSPDFILTTGDNNYNNGSADTIDENIGKFYHEFIYPYYGSYGEGAQVNRFFPSLGNHDWRTPGAQPYLDYFSLPGNERYYDFTWGLVHFFIIDSDPSEPDGYTWDSNQALWLQAKLAGSISQWKIVVFHHAPYSSGDHGSNSWMQKWKFAEWGADVVLSGHDHTYERIAPPADILYFVNGLGGKSIYAFPDVVEGSQIRYNGDYGAMLVDVSFGGIRFRFINRQGETIDDFSLVKPLTNFYLPSIQKSVP
jgi:tartrate-resistant acid phosphatase type 5